MNRDWHADVATVICLPHLKSSDWVLLVVSSHPPQLLACLPMTGLEEPSLEMAAHTPHTDLQYKE